MEEILYRGYGPHARKGGGFSTLGVKSEAEMQAALASGWFKTLPEAIDAHDNPKPAEKPEDAPPTREEMEQQAKELGLKFDGRTTDAALLRKINDALEA